MTRETPRSRRAGPVTGARKWVAVGFGGPSHG